MSINFFKQALLVSTIKSLASLAKLEAVAFVATISLYCSTLVSRLLMVDSIFFYSFHFTLFFLFFFFSFLFLEQLRLGYISHNVTN